MRLIVLVAACLACVGHASRVQTPNFQQQVQQIAEQMSEKDLQTLVTFLLASSPKSAFTFSGLGTQPVTANRNAAVKMQTPEELLQKQEKQIAELQAQVAALQQQQGQPVRRQPGPPPTVPRQPGPPPTVPVIQVQGGTLKTWSYQTMLIDRVQVVLSTSGRPLSADVQLWEGPENTPVKMNVYSEDGSTRPFSAVIGTPSNGASTVAIKNVGDTAFPLAASVIANDVDEPMSDFRETSTIVQGGALRTFEFNPPVESVEVMLKTDGRPLNAKIELLEGPNNQKQVIELHTEDGLERPFFAIVDTAGSGNVVRVMNTAPIAFPMYASVQPHSFG